MDPEAEQPEAQEVIELASLAGDAESDLEAGQDEAENEPDGDDTSQSEAASEQDDRGRPRNVVDEIEAVFGGPGAWASMVQQAVSEPGTEGETGEPVYQTDEHASVPGGEGGQTTDEPRDIPATEAVSDGTHLTHSPQYDHEQTAAPPYAGEPEHQGAVQPSKDPLHGDSALPSGASKSLEESVKELLRPMLQEWLDKNMPRLVEAAMREQAGPQGAQPCTDGCAPTRHATARLSGHRRRLRSHRRLAASTRPLTNSARASYSNSTPAEPRARVLTGPVPR